MDDSRQCQLETIPIYWHTVCQLEPLSSSKFISKETEFYTDVTILTVDITKRECLSPFFSWKYYSTGHWLLAFLRWFLFLKFLLIFFSSIFWLHLVKTAWSESANKVGLLYIYRWQKIWQQFKNVLFPASNTPNTNSKMILLLNYWCKAVRKSIYALLMVISFGGYMRIIKTISSGIEVRIDNGRSNIR